MNRVQKMLVLVALVAFAMLLRASGKGASVERDRILRVGVMLPLHDTDGDGRRMTEYYRGLLIAADSLRAEGVSVDFHAWNVDAKADIGKFTGDLAAAKCDIIFGPLYTAQVHALAEFCKARDIPMVIPFSISGDDVASYRQIFQVWQSPARLCESSINTFLKLFAGCHPVFIDCNDKASQKGAFTFGLRQRLEGKGVTYNITNLTSSEDAFAKAFSRTQRNLVILNTGRSPELTLAFQKLQGLAAANPSVRISLYGYTEWLMYLSIDLELFHRFDTYIPSNFYYNPIDPRTRAFEQSYRRWFHNDMQQALPRFALTGFDQGCFFFRGLAKYGKAFKGLKGQSDYIPLQTPLEFKQVSTAGMQNTYFQLVHFTSSGNIEAISF